MKIKYRSNYFDDPDATASFEYYAKEVHGLDFNLWKTRGLWDKHYIAFSAFIGDECIASICVYPSEMKIGGIKKKGAQLLTVGTLPGYRLKGIQKELWENASTWIKRRCDFVFLFTDESTAGFYEKLGLRKQPEHFETINCPQLTSSIKPQFRKLNIENPDDYQIILV